MSVNFPANKLLERDSSKSHYIAEQFDAVWMRGDRFARRQRSLNDDKIRKTENGN